jgi:hypothetical protein
MIAEGRSPRLRKALLTRPKELELHKDVAALLRKQARPDWRWTYIPTGERRDLRTAVKLKQMGTMPGWPDLILVAPGGRLHCLELKRRGETLSDAQEAFRAWCICSGVPHVVADTMADVMIALRAWGVIADEAGAP